jgi:hypothetical protein
MSKQGAAIPAFVVEVLVHPQGRVAQAGPGAPHRVIGSRATHPLEIIALVQSGKSLSADLIETKRAPFVAGSIIASEENKGILQIPTLFEQ